MKYYVVAYKDEDGIDRVAPKNLTVRHRDYVIWANNLSEAYTAQDFQGPSGAGQLFPKTSYPMPPKDTSTPAQVQVSQIGISTFTYNCVDSLGQPLDPVIIVDNPGMDDDDDDGKRQRKTQKGRVQKSKTSKGKASKAKSPKSKKRR